MDCPVWTVIFCNPEPLPPNAGRRDRALYWFLNTFLKPGFRHVYLMRRAYGFHGWLVVNPGSACLDVLEVAGDDYYRLVQQRMAEGHARMLEVKGRRPERWVPRGLFSCVSTVKHVLGVECGICATPWQFYNKLNGRTQPMGGFFSSPSQSAPTIDTSAADAARAKADKEAEDAKKKNEAKTRNSRNRGRGRALLAFADTGMEGVPGSKSTLG